MRDALQIVQKYFPEVVSVKDATEDSLIEVTGADVKAATVQDHRHCALAVACQRKLALEGVIVSIHTIYTIKGKQATRYFIPASVSREIVSFDRKGGFMPGEYKINKVPKAHKLGRHHEYKRRRDVGAKKPQFKHFTTGIRTVLGAADIS